MCLPIWALILIILAAGVIGVFIYRNNRGVDPYLSQIDELWDKLEDKIEAKLAEMKAKGKL